MGRKKKNEVQQNTMTLQEINQVQDGFHNELNNNPLYSLEVDPLNKYNFSDLEKEFIKYMVDYKSIGFIANVMMNIPKEQAVEIYKSYNVKEEIKRINLAMYARRFCSKMADLESLGGYLTTALTDENVPIADRLSGKDKLKAAQLLIELNKFKMEAFEHPETLDVVEVEAEIKKLNVKDIEKLIANSDTDEEQEEMKTNIINEIDKDSLLSAEEIGYLRSLSLGELEKLKNNIDKGGNKNEK